MHAVGRPRLWPSTGSRSLVDLGPATLVVASIGVLLRVVQWLGNPSLWLDELWVAENVLERDTVALLVRGLDHGQVAPAGFLLLEKLAVIVLGDGELALRLVPMVASIAALVLFARLARDLLGPAGAFVATACFALNPLLISLSAVAKQYSVDVLVTVLLFLALRRLWTGSGSLRSRTLIAAGAGSLGFLSIPSVMIAAAALVALLCQAWRNGALQSPAQRARALLPLLAWGGVAAVAALAAQALLTPPMQEYMRAYWTDADAFAPSLVQYPTWLFGYLGSGLVPGWLWRPYFGPPSRLEPALHGLTSLPAVVVVIGGATLALARKQGTGLSLAILLPFLFSVALSRSRLYPLAVRTSVFLLPLAILLLAGIVPERVRWLRRTVLASAILFLGTILVDQHPVYRVQRTRELIRELADRRKPNEPVYAYPWAWPAVLYYGSRFGVTEGLYADLTLTERVDVDPDSELPSLLEELEAFEGEGTLWVLFTTQLSTHRDLLLCYLDKIGIERDRVALEGAFPAQPVSLHRYDLSDATRWQNAEAETFPLPPEAFQGPTPTCHPRSLLTDGG